MDPLVIKYPAQSRTRAFINPKTGNWELSTTFSMPSSAPYTWVEHTIPQENPDGR
jgi:hypothetical protein